MFSFSNKRPNRKLLRLEKQVLDLEALCEAKDRQLAVANAEIESLANVIARDRERVKAESAAYARARADSEGVEDVRTK